MPTGAGAAGGDFKEAFDAIVATRGR